MGTHNCSEPLRPGPAIRDTLRDVSQSFESAGMKYWLCFGGLFAMIKNDGVIPDADFDFCTTYGQDQDRLIRAMEARGYKATKVLLNDADETKALYVGFGKKGSPHVCVSFWYQFEGILYYCHDQKNEVQGRMAPKSGYWFKGIPANLLQDDMFKLVEWPGLDQDFKVRVPMFAGTVLDYCYPCWAYSRQRYQVSMGKAVPEKMQSVYQGHAVSPYMLHLESMMEWEDPEYIQSELKKGKAQWEKQLKELRNAQ